jgi:hypothetical protein
MQIEASSRSFANVTANVVAKNESSSGEKHFRLSNISKSPPCYIMQQKHIRTELKFLRGSLQNGESPVPERISGAERTADFFFCSADRASLECPSIVNRSCHPDAALWGNDTEKGTAPGGGRFLGECMKRFYVNPQLRSLQLVCFPAVRYSVCTAEIVAVVLYSFFSLLSVYPAHVNGT